MATEHLPTLEDHAEVAALAVWKGSMPDRVSSLRHYGTTAQGWRGLNTVPSQLG